MERLVTNDYRMFWSPTYNKIHLYWGKKLKFNSLEAEFEYCKKGIVHIIEQIKKSNLFLEVYLNDIFTSKLLI